MYHECKFYCRYSFTVILHEKIENTWNNIRLFVATFSRISNLKISQVCVYRCIEQLFDQTSRMSWKRNRERKNVTNLIFLERRRRMKWIILLYVSPYYFSSIFSRNNFIHFFTYNHPFLDCTIITGTLCIAITII